MEAEITSETLVTIYHIIECHNPEDSNPHSHSRQDLKFLIIIVLTLLAEDAEYVKYGVVNSVIGCFFVVVENCRKQDGD
jgi:hypothetical protein